MSADAVLWIVMAFCLIVGCPIFVSLGVASTLALILTNIPMRIVALDMLKVMDMFPLLAVVGFIFAGALMEKGGMARQIVDVASLFVGRIRGGLGITTILGCLFFAAMIGSGPGTVAAMGSIMIPTMVRRGYSPEYAAGVCATGGTLGILIPPSNPMIIYGIIANTSIAALFTAGFVPGFLLGFMMMLMAYFLARRAGFTGTVDEDKDARFWPMFRKNFFSLMAPVIILGSIYAGICTPVEASVVAVFYALFVGTCITRELKIAQLWDAIKLTNVSAGSIIIVLGVSTLFGRILTMQRIPHQLANAMITLTDNPYVILVLIGLLLLFLGMFMETTNAARDLAQFSARFGTPLTCASIVLAHCMQRARRKISRLSAFRLSELHAYSRYHFWASCSGTSPYSPLSDSKSQIPLFNFFARPI